MGIMTVSNRGDVDGYNEMWGSVIAAAHWGRVTSVKGIGYQPTTFIDPIAGVSGLDPARYYVPRDGSSPAYVLANTPNYLTSLITWEGQDYLYGGRTQHPANDPRRVLAHDIVTNAMVADAQRDLVIYHDQLNTPSNRESLRLHIQRDLEATYLGSPLRSITVFEPLNMGGHLEVEFLARFPDLIESIRLTARVTNQEAN